MHARTGRIQFEPDRADDVVSHVRENIVPRYEETDGFKGFTLLLDRSRGEGLGISFWESEDAVNASDELGESARADIKERGEAQADPEAKKWEVVVDDTA